MKVKIAQINTVTGDIKGNFKKIKDIITQSIDKKDCDTIVFPETAITGYCCGSLWDREDFVKEQEEKVYELLNIIPDNFLVIIGYVRFLGIRKNGFLRLRNSAAIINNGQCQYYDKQLLANSDHHEDRKYFESGKESKVFDIKLNDKYIKIGVPICEDIWYTDHTRNIPKEMKELGADMIICINQSYFYYGKNDVRFNIYSTIAKNLKIPVVAVNNIGIGDILKNILIYDGNSMIVDSTGELCFKGLSFKEDITIMDLNQLNLYKGKYEIRKDKYSDILKALKFEQSEMFKLQGIKVAQIHMSGGIDSAIVGAITALTHEKENIVFITNPSSYNSSKTLNNAKWIADKLNIKLWTNPIENIYNEILKEDKLSFGDDISDVAKSCIQATLRTCLGLYNAHRFKSTLISTTNHTELCLGFSTYLDVSYAGIHTLLGDLTKIELFEFAKHLNEKVFFDEIIPKNLYNGECEASAELPDNSGPDPINYLIQSGLCSEIIRNNKSKKQLIEEFINKTLSIDSFPLVEYYKYKSVYDLFTLEDFKKEIDFTFRKLKSSVYKCGQAAPVPCISKRMRGFSSRETLINKYDY